MRRKTERKLKRKQAKQAKTVTKEIKRLMKTVSRACAVFKAPENITVSQWADRYRILQAENSAESGKWKTKRTPYLKEIMDAFTDPRVKVVVIAACAQLGKTEALLNMIAYMIDQDPGPAMLIMPTVDMVEDTSKRRLSPMFRDTKPLIAKVASEKSRNSNNTITKKSYPGGMLTLVGANSPAPLAGVPARYVFGDEIDRWTKAAGKEGDPWGLVQARTITFYNSKMVAVSTPTVKDDSKIEDLFKLGTREYWSVQCPDCEEYSYIKFDNIRFDYKTIEHGRDKQYIVENIGWACPHCGCIHNENTVKHQPMKWVPESPEAIKNGYRSFWINGFSSPWLSWEYIITRFLQAGTDPEKLKVVYNTLFGELWSQRVDVGDEEELMSRAEDYGAELPEGVLALTCGVDTQDDRLEYEVVGYGFFEENWGIERGIIQGRPDNPETWIKLDGVLDHAYSYKNGRTLRISLCFVDEGGHFSKEVWEQCAMRPGRMWAVKGSSIPGYPYTSRAKKIEVQTPDGRPYTTYHYIIGTDAGKERIMSGLKVLEPGARMSHFPTDKEKGYDIHYFHGLLSEAPEMQENGGWKWKKLPGHDRNEALDCRNYANAAFKILHPNLDRIKYLLEHPDEKKKPVKRKQQPRKRRIEESDW